MAHYDLGILFQFAAAQGMFTCKHENSNETETKLKHFENVKVIQQQKRFAQNIVFNNRLIIVMKND